MVSAEGGIEIEEVAAKRPEAILKEPVDGWRGLDAFRARRLAYQLGVPKELAGRSRARSRASRASGSTPTRASSR